MFLYVCMYGLSCTCCTCTCAGRRSRSGLFPNSSLPCLMKQGHEINLKLSDKVKLAGHQVPQFHLPLPSQCWGCRQMVQYLALSRVLGIELKPSHLCRHLYCSVTCFYPFIVTLICNIYFSLRSESRVQQECWKILFF